MGVCNNVKNSQRFGITSESEIRAVSIDSTDFCLQPNATGGRPVLGSCDDAANNVWSMTTTGELRHVASDLCLVAHDSGSGFQPAMRPCELCSNCYAEDFAWSWRCGANFDRPEMASAPKSQKLCGDRGSLKAT